MKASTLGICGMLLLAQQVAAQEPARTDGWVVLPVEEYRTLRNRAFPSTPDPAPPPIDVALTRVDYNLRANGDTASGHARLTIDVLKQGWVSVQIPEGILVRDARLDGRATALVDGTPPRVLISRPGRSALTLEVVVPLTASAGTESMTLPPSAAALSAVTFTIPRTGVDLSVSGGFVAEQSDTTTESRWLVYGTAGRPAVFTWKRKADDRRATLPLRARARITELVVLGEDASQVTASVRLEVVQGLARQIELALPDGLAVNQVSGAMVSDWNHNGAVLAVSFLEPVATDASVVVNAETRAPRDGAVAVPLVRMPAAEREVGGVAVDVVGAGEIAERQPRGLEPADPLDLGDVVAGRESPSMVAFQYKPLAGSAARELTVTVSRYAAQSVLVANVEEARYEALVGEDGKTLVHARYAVRNNQRSFLAITLPAQSALWSAALGGQPIRPGVSTGGGLLLPLQKGRPGESAPTFVVEVFYLQRTGAWTDKGLARIELPALDLPISRTGLTLHHSPRFRVDPRPGVFRVEDDPGPWSATLRAALSTGTTSRPAALPAPPPPPAAAPRPAEIDASKDLKVLIDRFEREAGRTRQGAVPIEVTFPRLGPSVFLTAELTAEANAPSLEINYKRGGER